MSRIFITGDTHGELEINKLGAKQFPIGVSLSKDDYVIICGDFGLIWDNGKTDNYWLEWLSVKPFTILFIDGNHENFDLLESYPVKEWNGGKVHQIKDNIFHLMRGQIFTINNKTFFTMGGATSTDKDRRKNICWKLYWLIMRKRRRSFCLVLALLCCFFIATSLRNLSE